MGAVTEELVLLAALLVAHEGHVVARAGEPERLRRRALGELRVDHGLGLAARGRVGGELLPPAWEAVERRPRRQAEGAAHDGLHLPRRLGAGVALPVDRPDEREHGEPTGESGDRDEEPETGAEVGGEQQVDGPAQDENRGAEDDRAADLRVPGERGQDVHHRLRS